jgi:hypothetical protein
MRKLFTWDYKDQPPLDDILTAFQEMVDYDQVPQFYRPDTGGDYYACIVSEHNLSPEDIEHVLAGDEPVSGEWDSPGTAPEEPGA